MVGLNIQKQFLLQYFRQRNSLYLIFHRSFMCTPWYCNEPNKLLDDVRSDADLDLKTEDEDVIESKRNKNRLPDKVYGVYMKNEVPPLEFKHDFKKKRLLQRYGKYGKDSGLNPGMMWPTKEELQDILEHDKMFHPPLQEMLNNVRSAKLEEERQQKELEEMVDKNMQNLDKWVKEYYDKIAKKKAVAEELREKRARLVEEISEYLGYDVDPKDPRFQEAIEQREKERKKAQKLKKQQESYQKMLQKLTEIAEKSENT